MKLLHFDHSRQDREFTDAYTEMLNAELAKKKTPSRKVDLPKEEIKQALDAGEPVIVSADSFWMDGRPQKSSEADGGTYQIWNKNGLTQIAMDGVVRGMRSEDGKLQVWVSGKIENKNKDDYAKDLNTTKAKEYLSGDKGDKKK